MRVLWRDAARHYLQVAAFCCVVAVLTSQIWPGRSYWIHLAYALSVGTITWLVIEFGRYAFDERHCHRDSHGGHGWPRGWRGILLTTAGIACGFMLGDPVADWVLGGGSASSSGRDYAISLVVTVLAGVTCSFYFHARGRAAALAASITAAERDASEAKLKLLETQLEPHMLFNTLANLRVLITTDPPRAVAMLDRLNSYLRTTLSGSRSLSHPLATEFARLSDYLDLMAVRMGDRLRFELDLPPELRQVEVPPLLLQPLVENAIRHGLEPKVEGGEIHVTARRSSQAGAGRILLEVRDTGVGFAPDATASPTGGFGVAQVRERLSTLHGDGATFRLEAAPGGGTVATIAMPAAD